MMSVGGGTIIEDERGEYLDVLEKRAHKGAQIKILLLDPFLQSLEERVIELNRQKPGKYNLETLRQSILTNMEKLAARINALPDCQFEIRYHRSVPIWRIYIFDDTAVVSCYLSKASVLH